MGEVNTGYNDYVAWTLKSEGSKSIRIGEPENWEEDSLKLDRHKEYHGLTFSYTGDLIFYGKAKDYIEQAYVKGGINTKCRLIKYIIRDKDGDVKWTEEYSFLADWKTKVIKDSGLAIKWNTFNLAELIRSHESDEFEAERVDSIDGVLLEPLVLNSTEITGNLLNLAGQSVMLPVSEGGETVIIETAQIVTTIQTKLLADGPERHASIDNRNVDLGTLESGSMFYVRETAPMNDTEVSVRYDLEFYSSTDRYLTGPYEGAMAVEFWLMEYDGSDWTIVETRVVATDYVPYKSRVTLKAQGTETFENIKWNQGLMIIFKGPHLIRMRKLQMWVNEISNYDSSPNLACIFVHDLLERLMYIISSEQYLFYSKYFGRTELLDANGNQMYAEDGPGGLIAYITGYWLRAFDPAGDKYKSITTSIKDERKALIAVFNIGATIENDGFTERLRFEDLKFFYRDRVVLKFNNQLQSVVRSVDEDLFFSAIKFGYQGTGDYESQNGLDEPNQISNYVTPVRASSNKFEMISKTRTDDTAMELTRRKPESDFPFEDTPRDDVNFFIDLKRTIGLGYTQRIWSDRLKELPFGIFSPETWKGMFFTPMRMLLRHSWIFRSGIEPYLKKYVKWISSEGNKNVETWAKDDWRLGPDRPLKESDDIEVSELDRSLFLPEIVTAEHKIDDEMRQWIKGTTPVIINGSLENVPNFYFKCEFITEDGKTERGYLLSVEPKGNGKIVYQTANENLI